MVPRFLLPAVCLLSVAVSPMISAASDWSVVAISGDNDVHAFDNARSRFVFEFSDIASSTIQLTNDDSLENDNLNTHKNTAENISAAIGNLRDQTKSNCLIYITSHGQKDLGVYIRRLDAYLVPEQVNMLLKQGCPKRPTVVLISACFSGQFINDAMRGASRIILTSARRDRTSFGCSSDDEYPYWDDCLFQNLENAGTWKNLHELVKTCVAKKEELGEFEPSEPQAFFGEKVANMRIFD